MSRLDKDLGNHTFSTQRIQEETVDTVALPQAAQFPPESLLTILKRLQLQDEGGLVGTGTGDEVISLDLLTALDVRATEVAGGMEMVQKSVPVSSEGTRPVFVVKSVVASTAIPIITAIPMASGLRTSFSTEFLYLPKILL